MGCCNQSVSHGIAYQASHDFPLSCCHNRLPRTELPEVKFRETSGEMDARTSSQSQTMDNSVFSTFGIRSLSSALSLIYSKDSLEETAMKIPYKYLSVPESVGSLALMYLCVNSSEISESFEEILEENSYFLLECVKGPVLDFQEYALLFLTLALNTQRKRIKQQLIKCKAIEGFLGLVKSTHRHLRILAIDACASIYRQFDDGQRVFLRNKGEWELIQLIKRDGDDEQVFLTLLDNIFDLIYVIYRQDEEGILIVSNFKLVANAHLMDIIMSMDISSVSFS